MIFKDLASLIVLSHDGLQHAAGDGAGLVGDGQAIIRRRTRIHVPHLHVRLCRKTVVQDSTQNAGDPRFQGDAAHFRYDIPFRDPVSDFLHSLKPSADRGAQNPFPSVAADIAWEG